MAEKEGIPQIDIESREGGETIPHWKLLTDQAIITPRILDAHYDGSGTEEDPFVVNWIDKDPRNPMNFTPTKKWTYALFTALSTFGVAFCSSAYSGGIRQMMEEFGVSQVVVTLGLSIFVVGFALGPLIWAPLSEIYGRQILFFITYISLTVFNAGCAGAQNMWTIIILRFFAGSFGSSPLTNSGGVIADMFAARERGLAMSIFAAAPFMGPVFGPIVGGFLGMTEGWRWVEGLMAIFTGVIGIITILLVPETYAPTLLEKRAKKLSKLTGKVYKSAAEIKNGKATPGQLIVMGLKRPWILLFTEPIVLLLSLYLAIVYGTLYLLFGALPIVYQLERGWSEGIGGLVFLGVMIGMVAALLYSIFIDDRYYAKAVAKHGGFAPPEARLPMSIIGAFALPIGMFWFAWTNYPWMPWPASVAACIPFGFGMVLLFLAVFNYLIDSYTIFAASVLAANSVIRSLFGAAFPLFTSQMYANLGIHWASSIPAFLALACLPFPLLFYKYGASIRARCKFAAESEAFIKMLRGETAATPAEENELEQEAELAREDAEELRESSDLEKAEEDNADGARFQRIKTGHSLRQVRTNATEMGEYEGNPYDLDRVNTKESFKSHDSKTKRGGLFKSRSKN